MPIPFPKHARCEDDRHPACSNKGTHYVLLPSADGGRIFWLCTECTSSQPA